MRGEGQGREGQEAAAEEAEKEDAPRIVGANRFEFVDRSDGSEQIDKSRNPSSTLLNRAS